ncbi:chaperone modulator CbpM [Oxalobacteraceae bacterium R-40]|uniref:Chaperone modulator CbpM n=1 Tax=Keguizhuia sedimenti TaxID=3064264 RepID=A0ABU1BKD2_9BURK|nr:chaperone modulator CbpM [Oxalobacteraceae bacterium R-40]
MREQAIVCLLEEVRLTLGELSASCRVSPEWVIEHVSAGVLLNEAPPEPAQWRFSGEDLRRARRLFQLERDFDANPELAGLVVDLFDELERLRSRLRRLGADFDGPHFQ